MSKSTCLLTNAEIEGFFQALMKEYPNPKSELDYTNEYTLLVAVALSAQATDIGVNKATKSLFRIVKTPQDMLDLGEEALKTHIRTIGLFNTKAQNIMKTAKILVADFNGIVPQTRKELESLPGVGRKTANVVLNVAFGQPTIAVDTHLFRVGNRVGIAVGKTPLQVELGYENVIPEQYIQDAHHYLILHGRYCCKAQKPNCQICPVNKYCKYDNKLL